MNIIHIASEINPFAKTGGLADVVGSLPVYMKRLGHDVIMFMPLYKEVEEKFSPEYITDFPLITADGVKTVIVKKLIHEGAPLFTIGCHDYFWRDELYGD
ncbi:MAG: glycogen/starch synthase, partial [Candidatus Muiribacteriaceae bacterium]